MDSLEENEIRLARLMPAHWDDPLSCKLFKCSLDSTPPYKALSYAWGASTLSCTVHLPSQNRRITASLDYTLRQARDKNEEVIVWADALCINQGNDREKSHQVRLMREIYAFSEETLICLRPNFEGGSDRSSTSILPSGQLFDRVELFGDERDNDLMESFHIFHEVAQLPQGVDGIAPLQAESMPLIMLRIFSQAAHLSDIQVIREYSQNNAKEPQWSAMFENMRQLIRRAWWNRVWTVQEVTVPKEIRIMYGHASATWKIFVEAAKAYKSHTTCCPLFYESLAPEYHKVLARLFSMVTKIEDMRQQWKEGKQTTLLQLLRRFRIRQGSDDRDKVYALLGLVRDRATAETILPDYTLSVAETYIQAAVEIIESTKCLSTLAVDVAANIRYDLPSWVPDWSTATGYRTVHRQQHIHLYNTTPSKLLSYELQRLKVYEKQHLKVHRALQISGVRIDTVEFVSYPMLSEDNVDSQVLREWYLYLVMHFHVEARPDRKQFQTLLWKVLCAEVVCVLGDPEDTVEDSHEFRRALDSDVSAFLLWCLYSSSSPFRDIAFKMLAQSKGSHKHKFLWWKSSYTLLESMINDTADTLSDSPDEYLVSTMAISILNATLRRRLFITSKNFVGLGPAHMESGDHIFLLQGGRTPFVLRLQEEPLNPVLYTLIGDCYIYGMMDGEAVSVYPESSWTRVSLV
jgi:hypothetical protein